MINNDLISTFVIKEKKEPKEIVQENDGDIMMRREIKTR